MADLFDENGVGEIIHRTVVVDEDADDEPCRRQVLSCQCRGREGSVAGAGGEGGCFTNLSSRGAQVNVAGVRVGVGFVDEVLRGGEMSACGGSIHGSPCVV